MRSSWQSRSRRARPFFGHGARRSRSLRPTHARWRTASAGSRSTTTRASQNPPVLRHPNGQPFSLCNRFRGGDLVTEHRRRARRSTSASTGSTLPRARTTSSTNPRTAAPAPVGGTLRVAALNTLNFFVTLDTTASDTGPGPCGGNANLDCRGADADQPLEFTAPARQAPRRRSSGLNGDIIGLNELENTRMSTAADPTEHRLRSQRLPGYGTTPHPHRVDRHRRHQGRSHLPARPSLTPVGAFKILNSAVDPRFIDTQEPAHRSRRPSR